MDTPSTERPSRAGRIRRGRKKARVALGTTPSPGAQPTPTPHAMWICLVEDRSPREAKCQPVPVSQKNRLQQLFAQTAGKTSSMGKGVQGIKNGGLSVLPRGTVAVLNG